MIHFWIMNLFVAGLLKVLVSFTHIVDFSSVHTFLIDLFILDSSSHLDASTSFVLFFLWPTLGTNPIGSLIHSFIHLFISQIYRCNHCFQACFIFLLLFYIIASSRAWKRGVWMLYVPKVGWIMKWDCGKHLAQIFCHFYSGTMIIYQLRSVN